MNDVTALSAILIPPQQERFRERFSLKDAPLQPVFTGWEKLVILSPEAAFLFPRNARVGKTLEREAAVLEVLARYDLPFVPRLIGEWLDEDIYAHRFIATSRLQGASFSAMPATLALEDLVRFMRNLGSTLAVIHETVPMQAAAPQLPPGLPPSADNWREAGAVRDRWLQGALFRDTLAGAVEEAVELLGAGLEKEWSRAALRGAWRGALEDVAICAPVLVHGDVCENQFLVDANLAITGVLDWGRAGIGHPLFDFDFGEWDTDLFRWEHQFEALRRALWEGYKARRDTVALPDFTSVHLLFSLVEAIFLWDRKWFGKPMTPWQKARLGLSLANVSGATRLLRL